MLLVRVLLACLFGVLSIVSLDAGNDPPSDWWTAGAFAVAFGALAIRSTRIGLEYDGECLVVRNLFLTDRIPLAEVQRFGIEWSAVHRGRALIVEKAEGRRAVTGYPMTSIPSVAERRTAAVGELNDWLRRERRQRRPQI
jgi:hypothetical protein